MISLLGYSLILFDTHTHTHSPSILGSTDILEQIRLESVVNMSLTALHHVVPFFRFQVACVVFSTFFSSISDVIILFVEDAEKLLWLA